MKSCFTSVLVSLCSVMLVSVAVEMQGPCLVRDVAGCGWWSVLTALQAGSSALGVAKGEAVSLLRLCPGESAPGTLRDLRAMVRT